MNNCFEVYITNDALKVLKDPSPKVVKMLSKLSLILKNLEPPEERRDAEFCGFSSYDCPLCIDIRWSRSLKEPNTVLLFHKEHKGMSFMTASLFEKELSIATRIELA